MIIVSLIDLKKYFGVHYRDTLKEALITVFSVSIMATVIILLRKIIPINNLGRIASIFGVALYALIGTGIYFIITYKTGSYNKIIGFKLRRKK